ncbi:MAG: hypothetical protein ACRDJN_05400 [Chloroflexota bacterium]
MRGKPRAWNHGQDERLGAGDRSRATPSGTPALPNWESFPAADRHQLVGVLVRAARRQVEASPVRSRPTT